MSFYYSLNAPECHALHNTDFFFVCVCVVRLLLCVFFLLVDWRVPRATQTRYYVCVRDSVCERESVCVRESVFVRESVCERESVYVRD